MRCSRPDWVERLALSEGTSFVALKNDEMTSLRFDDARLRRGMTSHARIARGH
jgi:hypothetical protein